MLFTTKTEYGMRAMVELAKKASQDQPLPVSQIARDQHLSQAYLERLFAKLKADGLIMSTKGSGGGYYLARPPKQINIFEIIEALDGPLMVFSCISEDENKLACSAKNCLTKQVWHELQKQIIHTLRQFTLKDLVN